jgi:hypothetical protein
MKQKTIEPYAPVIIKLLKNIIYYDNTTDWTLLLRHTAAIREYFGKIGLKLQINEAEGYAYVEQPDADPDDGESKPLPRLTRRSRLTYHDTLLSVLLREQLQQFDARNLESSRLVLSKEQIRELVRLFFAEQSDETRLMRDIDRVIKRVENLGFLKKLKKSKEGDKYEVRRILKAMISADKLVEIKGKLETYAKSRA